MENYYSMCALLSGVEVIDYSQSMRMSTVDLSVAHVPTNLTTAH